jgi:YidC/Oxa1 family membrane protein insertase
MDLGQVLNPLYQAIASLLSYCYALIPNYAIAIALLTLIVMVVLSPLTLKSTRSMLAMQKLQPEMKKMQTKYKGDRQKLNEEMMKFYKENKINPLGGCLPLILQLPVFFILYSVVRGLIAAGGPKYISHSSQLYNDLVHSVPADVLKHSGAQMVSFGIDLSRSATSVHGTFFTALPFYLIIIIAIGLQYLQLRQLSARNPAAAAANPQMQRIQKFMPLFFSVIYIGIPAAVNIYFIVSSLARIGQQELMFRYDPQVRSHAPKEKPVDRAGGKKPIDVKEVKPEGGSKKPGGPGGGAPRRDRNAAAKADGDGQAGRQQAGRQQRARAGDGSNSERSKAIEAKATNGSESPDGASKPPDGSPKSSDGTRSPGGAKSPGGGRSPGGAKAPDGSKADWSKAPRQKPHRSQSKRTRKSR